MWLAADVELILVQSNLFCFNVLKTTPTRWQNCYYHVTSGIIVSAPNISVLSSPDLNGGYTGRWDNYLITQLLCIFVSPPLYRAVQILGNHSLFRQLVSFLPLVAGWKDIGFAFGTTVGEVGKTGASEWGRGGGAEGSSSFLCYLPLFHSGHLPIPTVRDTLLPSHPFFST